jgi:CII-binding regulator of phage lambda lysogenization HflD
MPATRTFFDPSPERCSDQMLSELLALDEEMIVQLRFERLEVAGRPDFLANTIAQH